MALLYGAGRFDFSTLGLSQDRLLPCEPLEFEISAETETKESQKFFDGKLVTAGSIVSSETYSMTIGIQSVNWLALQFAYGELAGLTASVALPEIRFATVPLTTPYEITDVDLTTTNVQAGITAGGYGSSAPWGSSKSLTRVTSAPAAASEFQVVTASTKLVFYSTAAGATIAYRVFKTYSNVESIGAEAVATTLSAFSFSGILYGDEDRMKIVIPRMTPAGIPSLNVSDVTNLSIEFRLVTSSGDRRPFKLYRLPAA